MNSDPSPLSFVFPARDFGRLAEKQDALESEFAGVSDETLQILACWHLVDPLTGGCVHCSATEKELAELEPDPNDQANAALLLRLRAFFRQVDKPEPYFTFEDIYETADTESVPIRVILAPVAKLENAATSKKLPLADRLIADTRDKFEGDVLVPLEAEAAKRTDLEVPSTAVEPAPAFEVEEGFA